MAENMKNSTDRQNFKRRNCPETLKYRNRKTEKNSNNLQVVTPE